MPAAVSLGILLTLVIVYGRGTSLPFVCLLIVIPKPVFAGPFLSLNSTPPIHPTPSDPRLSPRRFITPASNMSEAQQPVADKPAVDDAPAAQPIESTLPATSETAAAEPATTETKPEASATDAPKTEAVAAEAPKEEKATEPVTHGALGYKAPGLMK